MITQAQVRGDEPLKPEHEILFLKNGFDREQSSELEWRVQGIKLFKKRYYDAAILCFNNSNDPDLVTRCEAYKAADAATGVQSEMQSIHFKLQRYKDLTKQ